MLTDGLTFPNGAVADNFQLQSGTSLPTDGQALGELFYLTTGSAGLYLYTGSSWLAVGTGVSGGGGGSTTYGVGLTISGQPTTDETLLFFPAPQALSLPTNATGSTAACEVAPSSTATFSIRKNGTQIGTVTFAANATTGTFTATSTSFSTGDVLSVVLTSAYDNTFSDIGIVITLTIV